MQRLTILLCVLLLVTVGCFLMMGRPISPVGHGPNMPPDPWDGVKQADAPMPDCTPNPCVPVGACGPCW